MSSSPSVIQLGPSIGPECVCVYDNRTWANGMPQRSATACRMGSARSRPTTQKSTSMSAASTGPLASTRTVARRSMSTPSARWCVWTPQPAWAMPMGGVRTARPTPARSVGVVTSRLLLDRHLAESDERPRLAVDVEAADLARRRPDEWVRLDPDPGDVVGDDLRDPLVDRLSLLDV